jgi:hypothetical protein
MNEITKTTILLIEIVLVLSGFDTLFRTDILLFAFFWLHEMKKKCFCKYCTILDRKFPNEQFSDEEFSEKKFPDEEFFNQLLVGLVGLHVEKLWIVMSSKFDNEDDAHYFIFWS